MSSTPSHTNGPVPVRTANAARSSTTQSSNDKQPLGKPAAGTSNNPPAARNPSGNPQATAGAKRPLIRSSTATNISAGPSRAQALSRQNTMANGPTSPTASARAPTIPFPKTAPEYQAYQKLIKLVAQRKPEETPRILIYTDIDQDYDDLLAIIFLAEMHRMGAVELAGFVANHHPVDKRASFLRTVLDLLGLQSVPVAKGSVGVEDTKQHAADLYYGLKNTTFINKSKNRVENFETGPALINRLAKKTGQPGKNGSKTQPLTVLLLSTLQDIGKFFESHQQNDAFLQNNFEKFVSQGGYKIKDQKGTLEPCRDMTNNKFHPTQTDNYHNRLTELNLRSDAWSREAAKAARMPGSFIQSLFNLGPIGKHLDWQWMRQEFKFFWDPLNIPFMPHLDVGWYLNTRLGMKLDTPEFNARKTSPLSFVGVAPEIKTIAYDCCAAVGVVGDDFMRAMAILVPEANLPSYNTLKNHNHRVFGNSVDDLGGVDPAHLAATMKVFLRGSLLSTMRAAEAQIPSASVVHQPVSYKLKLDFFEDKVLPPLKRFRAHQAMANALSGKAAKAKKDGDEAEAEKLLAQAGKERAEATKWRAVVLPIVKEVGMEDVPGADDIPYEYMFQKVKGELRGKRAEAAKV